MLKKNQRTSTLPTYQFIFSPDYWKSAAKQYTFLHIIATVGVLIALDVALSTLFIPVGDNLRIKFDFLTRAVIGMVGGPFLALSSGMMADLLGFVLHPVGAFFPGYTLSAMLGSLVYALFFYRSKINIVRIVLAKLTVNLFINVLLGSVWSVIIGKHGYLYYLTSSVIKNSIILNDVYLGDNTHIENCIVESRDTIRANSYHCGEDGIKIVVEKNERYAI